MTGEFQGGRHARRVAKISALEPDSSRAQPLDVPDGEIVQRERLGDGRGRSPMSCQAARLVLVGIAGVVQAADRLAHAKVAGHDAGRPRVRARNHSALQRPMPGSWSDGR